MKGHVETEGIPEFHSKTANRLSLSAGRAPAEWSYRDSVLIGGDNMLGTALGFVAGYVVGGIVNVSFVIVWCLRKIGKKNGGHA